jgi:hypothetical protein
VVYPIEKLLDIDVHHDLATFGYVSLGLLQCLVGISSGSESVARLRKGRVQQWFEHLEDGLLHETVHDCGYAKLPLASPWLGNVHPSHRLGSVASVQ